MSIDVLTNRIEHLERCQDQLKADQKSTWLRLNEVEQDQAATAVKVSDIEDDIRDIKDGQRWSTRYALGALVTTILTLITLWITGR